MTVLSTITRGGTTVTSAVPHTATMTLIESASSTEVAAGAGNHHCSHPWSGLRREWRGRRGIRIFEGCGRCGGRSKCRVKARCRGWRVNLKKSGKVTVADISLSGFTETIYSTLTKTCNVTVSAITVTMCGSDCYCSFFSSPSMHVANQRSQPRQRLILSRPRHRRAPFAPFAPQP